MINVDNECTAFVLITCVEDKTKEVIKQLQKTDGIDEISETKGPYDLILKVKSNSLHNLKKLLNQKIRSLDSIKFTLTLVVTNNMYRKFIF